MKDNLLKIKKLTCEGCNCGHCGQPVLILLKSLFGVMTVHEDFNHQTVKISYEEDVITLKEILSILKKRGFEATLI